MTDNISRIKNINERIARLNERKIKAKTNKESLERSILADIKELAESVPDLNISIEGEPSPEKFEYIVKILEEKISELEAKELKEIEEKERLVREAEEELKKIDNEAI